MPRFSKNRLLQIFAIGLPMALAIFYYGFLAANRYVAESKVTIKETADQQSSISALGLGSLLGASPVLPTDAMYLKEYILSLDMFDYLQRELNIKEAFGQPTKDILLQLPKDATQERVLEYYRARVNVYVDPLSSVVSVSTEGFTPEFAQRLNQAILTESERFINDISHRIAQEQMDFATRQVELSLSRLVAARDEMVVFQNTHGVFDPLAQADTLGKMILEMQAKQAQLEAELRNLQTYLNEDSPQVVSAKNAIKSLQAQIGAERDKVAAPGNNKMNQVALKFLQVKGAVEFNTDLYKMSLAALEKTRIDAARKIKSLVVLASPHRPERSDWQRQLLNLATLLLVTLLLYGLIKLSWAVIEDHRD